MAADLGRSGDDVEGAGDADRNEDESDAERNGDAGLTDRLFPVFDHTHDPVTTGLVVAFAAVTGLLAGWITADFGVRTLAFIVGAVGAAYLLYGQPTRRAVVAAGLYSVAALFAVAPFLFELGTAVNVDEPLRHVLSVTDLLVVAVFWVLAAVPAVIGYRVATGPFIPRIRGRVTG